ncbi:hypothetical protein Tco_0508274 [Tanacetum coccineum]
MSWFSRCSWCGGPFNGGYCVSCTNVSFGDEFVRNPDPISNDETPDFSYPPPQPQTSSLDQFHCFHCKDPLEEGERCQRCTCKWCEYGLREGSCWICPLRDENSSIDAPNSFNDLTNVLTYPPQPQYETYSCELCGNDSHHGYDCPPRFPLYSIDHQEDLNQQRISDVHDRRNKIEESQNELLNTVQSFCEMVIQQKQAANIDQSPPQEISIQDMEDLKQHYLDEMQSISNQIQIKDYRNERIYISIRRECEIMIDELKGKFNGMIIEINKKKELRQLEQAANLSNYTIEPSRRFNFYDDDDYEEITIPLNEITSQIPLITPVLPTMEPEDSLIMGNEELSTILEKESDGFIKPSIKDLVLIPSPRIHPRVMVSVIYLHVMIFLPLTFQGKSVTFSNPLFDSNDDFTFSDDESLSDEDVSEDNVKIYSSPLFEFDDEYISSDVNPLFDDVFENIENKDPYDSNLDEPALLVTPLSKLNEDEYFDPGGDVDKIELLLHHDPSTPKISIASILEGFTNEPSLEENDDLFDLESKENEWKKILYDAPTDDLMTEDKVFYPGIHETNFSPTYVRLPFEDRHYLSLTYVI